MSRSEKGRSGHVIRHKLILSGQGYLDHNPFLHVDPGLDATNTTTQDCCPPLRWTHSAL